MNEVNKWFQNDWSKINWNDLSELKKKIIWKSTLSPHLEEQILWCLQQSCSEMDKEQLTRILKCWKKSNLKVIELQSLIFI